MFNLFLFTLLMTKSFGWDEHQKLMSVLMESSATESRAYLQNLVTVPCLEEEKKVIHVLAVELQVNEEKVPLFSKIAHTEDCTKSVKMKVQDLIQSQFIDEPDFGMDQDLPESADPKGDRDWMGGKTGATSQGFRHMFFSGMKWNSIQVPIRAIGQAPERFNKIHAISERFFKEGNVFWGLRTLIWSLHFVQDLYQPFHSMQIPSLKMVPFKTLFNGFVARTTQVVANFHFAYEGLILDYLKQGPTAGMSECLNLKGSARKIDDIFHVIDFSNQRGKILGSELVHLFPKTLMSKEFDLTRREDPDGLDYYSIINAAEESAHLKKTFEITCELLQQVSVNTWGELDQAFKP